MPIVENYNQHQAGARYDSDSSSHIRVMCVGDPHGPFPPYFGVLFPRQVPIVVTEMQKPVYTTRKL